MKIDAAFQKQYPKLVSWVEDNLPKVKSKSKVRDAFLKYSELTYTQATTALTKGSNPEIYFLVMPRSNGQFQGEKFSNRVFLEK